MKITDKIGNELKEGDLIQVDLKSPNIFVRIQKISPGGIAKIGGMRGGKVEAQVTMGLLECTAVMTVPFHPDGARADGVLLIGDPEKQKDTTHMLV